MTLPDLAGSTLGRFDIRARLGQGGMAVVYLAQQRDLERRVALKILRPDIAHDGDMVARFHQEARSAARLDHPHIVPIYDIGELETPEGTRLHYIAMKYIEGTTLKGILRAEGRLHLPHILALLTPIGSALDYAHEQGIIHRDIKPSNILIGGEGHVYLSDFGLACGPGGTTGLTRTGMVMGTPEYMSPEQAEGQKGVGPATDIYALGVVLYEMLTGEYPFQADTPMAMVVARLTREPRPLHSLRADLPPGIEACVMRALARQPQERFASVAEMLAALQQQAEAQPASSPQQASTGPTIALPRAPASPALHRQRAASPLRQAINNPLITLALAALIIALVFGVGIASLGDTPPAPTPVVAGPTPAAVTPPQAATPVSQATPVPPAGFEQAMQEGWTALEKGEYNTALQAFDTASSLADSSARPFYGKGRVFMQQGDYDEAIVQFTQAVQHESKNAELHAWLGKAYLQRGAARDNQNRRDAAGQDYEQAALSFRRAISLDNRQKVASTGLGWVYYYQQAYPEAREQFEAALRIDANQAEAHNGLGWTLYTLHDYGEARTQFYQAIADDAGYVNAYYGLGRLYEEMGDTNQARQAYQSVLDLDPQYQDVQARFDRLE